jgi:glycosyltransferase involved in cell wall biosynthesis
MRVLYFTPSIGNGGVEKMMYEWMTRLADKDVQFDIVTNQILSDKYYEIFKGLTGNIYEMNFHQLRLDKKIPILKKIFLTGQYDVFHVHSCFSFDAWMMWLAKCCGIKVRIIHSHNAHVHFRLKLTSLLDKWSKPFLRRYSTLYMACSKEAGYSLLGTTRDIQRNLIIMENGIEVDLYKPNQSKRDEMRAILGVEDKKVLGSVGRLGFQKNYRFLIDVFKKVVELQENAILILVGSGNQEDELKQQVKHLHLEENVIFLGERQDVPNLLQAFDVFALTSIFEGLGISLIEAQCNGLPCIASSQIPKEVNVTNSVLFLDLEADVDVWANAIIEKFKSEKNMELYTDIVKSGYDIANSANKLYGIYNECLSI